MNTTKQNRLASLALTLLALILLALISGPLMAADDAGTCKLSVLLTNDDGWDAPGIQALRQGLNKAGHQVTLVAPLTQQSGRGGAFNTDVGSEVSVVEQQPGVWSVDGTPTDSIRAALDVIMKDQPPALVVSGSNFGQNLGRHAGHSSGTIGAAVAAHFDGIPAIAISTGILIKERSEEPPYPSTLAGFDHSANIVVNTIQNLTGKFGCNQPWPSAMTLNINVPVPAEDIKGIRWAPLSDKTSFSMNWFKNPSDGKVRIGFKPGKADTENPKDDVDWFAAGYVTFTPINGDITVWSPAGLPQAMPELDSLLTSKPLSK